MTAKVWNTAFDLLMINEGGYVNDPKDSGGQTKYGISKKAYPDLDIPNLTIAQAMEIYRKDYWDRCKCDYIPDALSVAVFDFAVNSGVKTAIKKLQIALGVKADGIIGNQTLGACNRLPVKKVLDDFMDLRLDYLMSLPKWKYYGNGWGSRVERTKKKCEELV
jgi:lysozyme family protein